MCFLYKCIHNVIDIDIRHILSFYNAATSRTRLGQQVLPLRSISFNSELAGLFFSNRVVKMWNILPNTIKQINCRNRFVKPFKKLLYNFYIVKLTTTYDIDNSCCPRCRQAWNTFLSFSFWHIPAGTGSSPGNESVLGQRRRRWASIDSAFDGRLVFCWNAFFIIAAHILY